MELIALCLAFLRVGVVSFGGGWTVVGIIKDEVVGAGWLTDAQFADVVAIAQVTPGPVALNAATLVGFRQAGWAGAAAATLSVVAFPMLSIVLANLAASRVRADKEGFSAALRVGTLAMVAMTLFNLSLSPAVSPLVVAVAVLSFAASAFTKTNPLLLIGAAGLAGAVAESLR